MPDDYNQSVGTTIPKILFSEAQFFVKELHFHCDPIKKLLLIIINVSNYSVALQPTYDY